MTTGETEETCGGQQEAGRREEGGNMKVSRSFTTLSTIAIQAGQSLLVISVLKSGYLVHVQLVQVHPGLCEIGSNQEENQTLIQEQQHLMEKLKKHEAEVLSVVERNQQNEQRKRTRMKSEETMNTNKDKEEVHEAMEASLNEGWSLLLCLLQRRQEVLTLAAEFYRRALEFAVSVDRFEDLQIRSDNVTLTEVQLRYDSMRKDLLGKSLQVLSSSSVLLQKLRQLQRTEALQRRGGVLQDQEEKEEEESSRCSRGVVLRVEELVETLQDRRRRADQAFRLQLQQVENNIKKEEETTEAVSEDWSLTIHEILDQDLQSTDLRSDSTTATGTTDLQPGSKSDLKSESKSDYTGDLNPAASSDQTPGLNSYLKPESRSEDTKDLQPRSELKPGSKSDLFKNQSGFTLNLMARSRSDLKSDSKPEESQNLQPGSSSDQTSGLRSYMKPESRSEKTQDLQPRTGSASQSGSRSEESGLKSNLQPGSRSDLKSEFKSDETEVLQLKSKSGSKPDLIKNLQSGFTLNLMAHSRSDLKSDSKPEETKDLQLGSSSDQMPGLRSNLKPESKSELQLKSRSEETKDLQPGSGSASQSGSKLEESGLKSNLQPGSRSDLESDSKPDETRDLQLGSEMKPGSKPDLIKNLQSGFTLNLMARARTDLKSDSKPEESQDLQPGSSSDQTPGLRSYLKPESRSELHPESRSEKTKDLQPRPRSASESGSRSEESGSSEQVAGLQSMLGKETPSEESHAHQTLLTNQRLQLLSSCERLIDKVCTWVQQGSSVLSNTCEAGQKLSEAEDTLNTHLQLQTQAESTGLDAENMKQILDQIRAQHASRTSSQPPPDPSRQLSPLRALTEQLKRRCAGGQTRTSSAPPAADLTTSLNPELTGRVDQVLKELQSLKMKIDSNLQLLRPYVSFLRTAQQVEEELGDLGELYRRRPEEEKEGGGSRSSVKKKKKKQVDSCWQETQQRLLTCQDLGNNFLHTVTMVCGSTLNLQSVVLAVEQTLEQLSRTKQEVNELQSQREMQIQEQQENYRKYSERLYKTVQDLTSVSGMLDSCTLMDLGSDLQTSRLLQRFAQAKPHFTQLDAEVEFLVKNWETVRGVQDRLEVEELKGGAVKEEELSELLELQERMKNKINESESILMLSERFHLTARQLEALLQSEPLTGSTGSSEAEQSQQIQSLYKTASKLKTDISSALKHSDWTGFRVEQLETRLHSLDSLRVSWLNEAAQREEKLRRQLLTCLLNDDIAQLRDSFKELKKRFSNLRFNYLKRNDRMRNMKAVRNQLQQVELYEEKLQALRKRLQGVTARLGSEVKDGGVAREAEDTINELQRQMGEFERSVSEHQKTLEMTCRLQQAMEEYQFWCEDASATIARVGKFSLECRSTEAVSVLYRQFEKFVWPTVPQQEERISQITELAVRLHGVEEGRRYIEKTVGKHSEMVESIRELSDGLMKLEAKLKLESLKQQQDDEEKEIKEEKDEEKDEDEDEDEDEEEDEEKDEEKEKLNEKGKTKQKEQTDNRSTQEAPDMYELKETGHTPELTTEHDGKEVHVKRETTASRKPPSQKIRSQEAAENRQYSASSYCSTHTFSLSCSPAEANRWVHAIHSQSQPATIEATPPPCVIGPSFSDIQREFQRKEAHHASNMTPLQDASAGGLLEAELQQQEAMTEDSLSNDEYDCVSPDDISLPPLAETPESFIVQSDIEEGFCFSSHSVHINQYSHQPEHTGAGAVRQRRESSQSCPTPPTSRHSSTRFRSESSSFAQSPLTVPPNMITSTLCSILKTGKTIDPKPSFPSGSNPAHKSNTPQSCSNKDRDVPEKKSPPQTDPLLKEHNIQDNQPQRSAGTQGKITQNGDETIPQTGPIHQLAKINHSTTLPQSTFCPQHSNGPDPDLRKDKNPSQDTRSLKFGTSICQESDLNQDMNSFQTRKETSPASKPQSVSPTNTSTSTVAQQPIYFQSSHSDSHHNFPKIDPVPNAKEFAQSLTDTIFCKDKSQETGLLKSRATSIQPTTTLSQDTNLSQSYPNSRSGLDQDGPSSQTSKETSSIFPQNSSLITATSVTKQTISCQPSPLDSHCTLPKGSSSPLSQCKILPQIDRVPQVKGFAQSLTDSFLHKDKARDTGLLKSSATCVQTTTSLPQDLLPSYPDSKSGLDQDGPSSQTSKETSSVFMPQSSSLATATTVTQQSVYSQSSPPDSHCTWPQASSNLRSQHLSPFSQDSGGLPEVHAPIPPEPNSVSNISKSSSTITNSDIFRSKQSHQTAYSFQESLTSTCTQQCVHDSGMTPSSTAMPAAPPQPKPQTQALAQQANLHVTPLSSPSHLLTPEQDPNICQPMAIREEIRLTPQIQWPPLPAPPPPPLPQGQAESLPQGKASKPGPPCFTRPLSRATVMEGSPVTLEVEVTTHPEPTLTWCKDEEVSATGLGRALLSCEDEKHFLFNPEALDSYGGLYEARAAERKDNSDKWLVAEVFDIISEDWQSWFGTLCVLLWLLYLVLL